MNKRVIVFVATLAGIAWTATSDSIHAHAVSRDGDQSTVADRGGADRLVRTYCVTCHNDRLKTGGLALDTADLAHVGSRPEVWEKVVRKLRAGLMPPTGSPRPERAVYDSVTAWLETELDAAAASNPNPGVSDTFHRLNRTEYQNAVRDVLGVEVDVASLLPADDASYGFDNIAGVLRMSPTLMERYLAAAQKIAALSIASPRGDALVQTFHVPDDLLQEEHVDGLPLGTRGGIRIQYTAPAAGTYEIKARLQRNGNDYVPSFAEDHTLEIAVDGSRLELFTLNADVPPSRTTAQRVEQDGSAVAPVRQPSVTAATDRSALAARQEERKKIDAGWRIRVPLSAGTHSVTIAFIKSTAAVGDGPRRPYLRPFGIGQGGDSRTVPYLGSVEVVGPYDPAPATDSSSRRLIFVCRPARTAEEAACARTILTALAGRAFRRPVGEADLEPLLDCFRQAHSAGGFDEGIEFAIERLLVSPQFLFRVERPARSAVNAAAVVRVSDLELASRLSFFLWSSVPDQELLNVAAANRLHEPGTLERQVRRMLADPRSDAFITNFAGQWLYLRNVPNIAPPGFQFPDFDEALRTAFRRETELFFGSIVREDRTVLDLLNADYTFVNERLARHYGIPGVKGTRFRRVMVADQARRGLLGQGSILSVTSYPNRTSPVKRGKWVLENLLGTPPPDPPPNVPSLKEEGRSIANLTMRQRMEQHRANPVCASCHRLMDPLGFALENFDAVGRFRNHDEAFNAIDPEGAFPDGSKFSGPQGLRQVLLDHSDQFVTTLTEKLLTYALGRGVDYYDAPAVRKVRRAAAANDFRFSAIVLGIVESTPFQLRRSE
jgi:mono/diheme cytochrome c family protein